MKNIPDHIYIDESIHHHLGFIVVAFVCVIGDPNSKIEKILSEIGFKPGVDEFKSRRPMMDNPRMQGLRRKLIGITRKHASVAISVAPFNVRKSLGNHILNTLKKIIIKNGLNSSCLKIYFDQGLFRSVAIGKQTAASLSCLDGIEFFFEQDSKKVLGLQMADAIAHTTSQVLREALTGVKKQVHIGGANTGYPEGTQADLGWSLLMSLRNSFFVRPVVFAKHAIDVNLATEPHFVSDEEDIVSIYQNAELFEWGVFISDEANNDLKNVVKNVFGTLWLGCIH